MTDEKQTQEQADEMTRFSKESILQQAATSMLAQAEDE